MKAVRYSPHCREGHSGGLGAARSLILAYALLLNSTAGALYAAAVATTEAAAPSSIEAATITTAKAEAPSPIEATTITTTKAEAPCPIEAATITTAKAEAPSPIEATTITTTKAEAPTLIEATTTAAEAPSFIEAAAPHPADTLELAAKAEEYLRAIDRLPIAQACAEVDFMIGAVQDSTLRSEVAVLSYRHFRQSHVMGSENVAIHIYDEWFASFRAVFPEIEDLDEAEMYAWINRRSLIGKQAVQVSLVSEQGDTLKIPSIPGCKCRRRPTILYFYSTGCPKCLYTSLKLKELFSRPDISKDFSADIVTVYTGEDDGAWQAYIHRELLMEKLPRKVRLRHLRGPSDGDYPLAYGVIQTPRLFLISEDGTILGRSLDADALEQLLQQFGFQKGK